LLGVAFDRVTLGEAVTCMERMIASGRPHHVVTANVDFLAQARRDPVLQRILLHAPLVLCDGTPLVWASRWFGNPLPERVAGADVVPELVRVAAERKYRVFFLGSTEAAGAEAVARLRQQFPRLIVSHYSPPFRSLAEMDHAGILRRIRAARPDLLFVAFGCPKAEKWISQHHAQLDVPVAMGIGATIDFLAGKVARAPRWMQRAGVEWVYRLAQEPRRLFKRYAHDLWFFGSTMLRQWGAFQTYAGAKRIQTPTVARPADGDWLHVTAARFLDRDSVERDAVEWARLGRAERNCLLELGETETMDSTGLAALMKLNQRLHRRGRRLVLRTVSGRVRRAIVSMGLPDCFEWAADSPATLVTTRHEPGSMRESLPVRCA
jgi:N-acetylglucosaminyldiphosphoundecaprenol N-acetyl-beta-D-mannosaminyltransferase